MLPSGWVTFTFTEIAGSTRLAQELGSGYRPVLRQYRRLLGEAVQANGGAAVFTKSDCCLLAFPDASGALAAGWAALRAMAAATWPDRVSGPGSGGPLVRVGLHSGWAWPRRDEYASVEVHRAARITQAAHGGQVLCSEATAASAVPLPPALGLRDLGLHRLRGFDGRERLFELLTPEPARRFPPPRTEAAASHNLPVAVTSFVGRDDDRASLASRLASHRLVSITGEPGVGKSRLAVQVAGEQVGAYPDGVWHREVAGDTAAEVRTGVAAALGLPPVTGQRGWRAMVGSLAGRRLLLVLDGCDAGPQGRVAAVVRDLLLACPGVRVLTTGRQPLGVPGEVVCWLRPLGLTGPAGTPGDAIRLLAERAAAARGGVAPDPAELPALARIAASLGGVPLAIERVAARLRVLSADQLAARLVPALAPLPGLVPVAPVVPGRNAPVARQPAASGAVAA